MHDHRKEMNDDDIVERVKKLIVESRKADFEKHTSQLPLPVKNCDWQQTQMDFQHGHTGEKYWMHYKGHVFLGKRTKHMQGVLLAIADIYDQPVPTLNEAHYKKSTYALPLNTIMHQIVVTDVFNSLADPFRLRELSSGEYTLIYNDHEITHPIKAVLAGYVVAVRALMQTVR